MQSVDMSKGTPKDSSQSESDLGELSNRFSEIEQNANQARHRHGTSTTEDHKMMPRSSPYRIRYNGLSHSSTTGDLGERSTAPLNSGIDSATGTDIEEDEPVWVRRDMSNERPLLGRSTSCAERPSRTNRVNFSDSCQSDDELKSDYEKKPLTRGKTLPLSRGRSIMKKLNSIRKKNKPPYSNAQRKQDTITRLIIQSCRKEKALFTRRQMVVEWQTIASVIDRLLFWIFLTATGVCYFVILFLIPYTMPTFPDDLNASNIIRRNS